MRVSNATVEQQQPKVFVTTLVDIPIRDARQAMERPLFSLSKNKRAKPIIVGGYNASESMIVRAPDDTGIATIWDKDILMWAVSQVREAINSGLTPSPTIGFHPYQLLRDIRRPTGGENYRRLINAFRRLHATQVERIDSSTEKSIEMFHWLEYVKARFNPLTGQPTDYWTMILPQWLYQKACDSKEVLSIAPEYFNITGGTERALYLLVRKHAGNQHQGWTVRMKTLHRKSGSEDLPKYYARRVRKIVAANALPDYWLELFRSVAGDEMLHAIRRSQLDDRHPGYKLPNPIQFRKSTRGKPTPPPFQVPAQAEIIELPFNDQLPF